jgi:putative transposase
MHDQLHDGGCIRLFNLIDDFKREALTIDADFSLPALRVIRIVRYHPETAAGHGRTGLLLETTEFGGLPHYRR